jgi:hypothetical protein
MRVKLSEKMVSDAGIHKPGDVVVVPDDQGQKMIGHKPPLAVEVNSAGNPVALPAPAGGTPPATG